MFATLPYDVFAARRNTMPFIPTLAVKMSWFNVHSVLVMESLLRFRMQEYLVTFI